MQSDIFKVESQFHQYRRTESVTTLQTVACSHVWLFRQARRAEPYSDTQTILRKVEKMQMHKSKGHHTDNKDIERNSDQ